MAFVLTLSMLREGYEDYYRNKADKVQNKQPVKVIAENQALSEIRSSDLKVGDFVMIKDGETFPADLAVLATSNNGN